MKLTETYVFSAKDLTELYNAKCELYALIEDLKPVVKADVLKPIRDAIKVMETVTGPLESTWEKEDAQREKHAKKLETKDSPAIWSCSRDPSEVIYVGTVVFTNAYAWNQKGKVYRSKPIVNPTYANAFEAFKEAIEVTGDTHHVFFEGVSQLAHEKGGVMHINLVSGS